MWHDLRERITAGATQGFEQWCRTALDRHKFHWDADNPMILHICNSQIDEIPATREVGRMLCAVLLHQEEACRVCGHAFRYVESDGETKLLAYRLYGISNDAARDPGGDEEDPDFGLPAIG